MRLEGEALRRWRGEVASLKQGGTVDRSDSLFFLGLDLAEHGATESAIVAALEERDVTLGWNKYSGRRDDREYAKIAQKAVESATAPRITFDGWISPNGHAGPKERQGDHRASTSTVGVQRGTWRSMGLMRLSEVKPERVKWAWPQRVPLGKQTLVDGDPGLGKSTVALDLAARVSRGETMPDGSTGDLDGPAGVVILSAEDGLADTIRPRLDAAGADCTKICALTMVSDGSTERLPTLADMEAIREAITAVEAKLVVIDPLMAYMPGETNAHRDQDVRSVLAQLGKLAEETGAAILVIRHLNKQAGGNPLYRGGGSIGIIGAARSALVVAKDPEDPSGLRRVLVPTKSNLSVEAAALAYRIVPHPNGSTSVGWLGEVKQTAASLLAIRDERSEDDRGAIDQATDVLRQILGDGRLSATEARKQGRLAGIADRTLDRAKTRLGVRAVRCGYGTEGTWYWELDPSKSANETNERQPSEVGALSDVGALWGDPAPDPAPEPPAWQPPPKRCPAPSCTALGFRQLPDGSYRCLKTSHDPSAYAAPFAPSPEWQEVPDGYPCPPGAEIRMDFATGKNWARWPGQEGAAS